jgi:hypothetical protein
MDVAAAGTEGLECIRTLLPDAIRLALGLTNMSELKLDDKIRRAGSTNSANFGASVVGYNSVELSGNIR